LFACSAAQQLASPYHLLTKADAGVVLDINSEGGALCSTGTTEVSIYRAKDGERQDLGGFTHDGHLFPAAAYVFGRDSSGWYLNRLSQAEGAQRYPAVFAKCEQPAGLRSVSNPDSSIVWRE
jgi:hypothetical protein